MSALIFSLLSIVTPEEGRTKDDEVKNGLFSTLAFIIGASTSILAGYLGMAIATYANARTAVEARKGIAPAFAVGEPWGEREGDTLPCCKACGQDAPSERPLLCAHARCICTAFRSGAVMGFLLSSLGLLNLYLTIIIFSKVKVLLRCCSGAAGGCCAAWRSVGGAGTASAARPKRVAAAALVVLCSLCAVLRRRLEGPV